MRFNNMTFVTAMGVRELRFLTTFLCILLVCSQYASTQATSATTYSGGAIPSDQFVIEPVIRPYPYPCSYPYPQPPPCQQRFNDFSNYQQPPPIVILDNGGDNGGIDLITLLLLTSRNRRGGGLFGSGGCGCGGCSGGCGGNGCGCGGYSSGCGCCNSYGNDGGIVIPPISLTITTSESIEPSS